MAKACFWTTQELSEDIRALFAWLAAEPLWDWGIEFPGITVSLSDGVLASRVQLDERISDILRVHRELLVDEYDQPILDNIDNSAVALEMREGLKNLYSVLKGSDAHLKLLFLTGASKFSKVSLFLGPNHIKDIALGAHYSALCGYTEADVDTVLAPSCPD